MYNHNITIQEMSDYVADMAEMSAPYEPTEAELTAMQVDHLTNEHKGYWFKDGDRWEWRDNTTDELRAFIEWDASSDSYCWTNVECDHGECQYGPDEIDLAKVKAMEDWEYFHDMHNRWGW